jgi:hypothetical protein
MLCVIVGVVSFIAGVVAGANLGVWYILHGMWLKKS